MPVLKHAKKKLRQDKVRTERNKKVKELYKKLIKDAKASKKAETVSKAFSSIDKAAKHHILPKNKAARMKSALAKAVGGVTSQAVKATASAEKSVKKVSSKVPAVKKTTAKKSAQKKK